MEKQKFTKEEIEEYRKEAIAIYKERIYLRKAMCVFLGVLFTIMGVIAMLTEMGYYV
jgi:hypothetical protein